MAENQRRIITLCTIFTAITAVFGYFTVTLGMDDSPLFYGPLAGGLVFGIAAFYTFKKYLFYKLVYKIGMMWGKITDRKRDMKNIRNLYDILSKEDKDKFLIDDQTWDDLNMDEIYSLVDRTITSPGESVLYNILRTPLFHDIQLKKRGEIIKLFENDQKIREKVQYELAKARRFRDDFTVSLLWIDKLTGSKLKYLYSFMALAAFASLAAIGFMGAYAFVMFTLPIFAINSLIHSLIKNKIFGHLSSIRYLSSLINTAGRIGSFKEEGLKEYSESLHKEYLICKGISRKTGGVNPDSTDVFYEYFDIFTLKGVRSFYGVVEDIRAHRDELKDIYLKIGELDALMSIASYRTGLKSYTEPDLVAGSPMIDVIDAWHPLLPDPVPNTISLKGEGVIITGSNMSGKSTFLRTLGVNTLLAQTIYTCLARSYMGSFIKVMTSISRSDNISGGKSYYLVEAEALLRIINGSAGSIPSLCIIDEIFRGTNSVERISASAEIMKYLVSHNSLVVIATHDLELAEMVKNLYRCYYFSERVGESGLDFDYKIKEGISNTRNAAKLMKFLGYPGEIVDGTNSRVEKILARVQK